MRQHANRIETELIARKGQQLTGQSPTICACGKIITNQLPDLLPDYYYQSLMATIGETLMVEKATGKRVAKHQAEDCILYQYIYHDTR